MRWSRGRAPEPGLDGRRLPDGKAPPLGSRIKLHVSLCCLVPVAVWQQGRLPDLSFMVR